MVVSGFASWGGGGRDGRVGRLSVGVGVGVIVWTIAISPSIQIEEGLRCFYILQNDVVLIL